MCVCNESGLDYKTSRDLNNTQKHLHSVMHIQMQACVVRVKYGGMCVFYVKWDPVRAHRC